jgi:hypothetical protein
MLIRPKDLRRRVGDKFRWGRSIYEWEVAVDLVWENGIGKVERGESNNYTLCVVLVHFFVVGGAGRRKQSTKPTGSKIVKTTAKKQNIKRRSQAPYHWANRSMDSSCLWGSVCFQERTGLRNLPGIRTRNLLMTQLDMMTVAEKSSYINYASEQPWSITRPNQDQPIST